MLHRLCKFGCYYYTYNHKHKNLKYYKLAIDVTVFLRNN